MQEIAVQAMPQEPQFVYLRDGSPPATSASFSTSRPRRVSLLRASFLGLLFFMVGYSGLWLPRLERAWRSPAQNPERASAYNSPRGCLRRASGAVNPTIVRKDGERWR